MMTVALKRAARNDGNSMTVYRRAHGNVDQLHVQNFKPFVLQTANMFHIES